MIEETGFVFRCILLNTMSTKIVTLRLDAALEKRLGKLARSTNRSRSFLAAEAIREYVATNEWQIEEIGKALKEADRGDFADDRDVRKIMSKWTKNAR
jgi:RHH-type rel operon transcriptional repressor/antitoxin RelB